MTTEQTNTTASVQEPSSPSADAAPDAQAPSEQDAEITQLKADLAKSENDRRSQEGRVSAAARRDADFAALTARQDASERKEALYAEAAAANDYSGLPAALKAINEETRQSTADSAAQTEAAQLQAYMSGLSGDDYKELQSRFTTAHNAGDLQGIRNVAAEAGKMEARLEGQRSSVERDEKIGQEAVAAFKEKATADGNIYGIMAPSGSGTPPSTRDSERDALIGKTILTDADLKRMTELQQVE